MRKNLNFAILLLLIGASTAALQASVVFETTTPYHHIRVVDQNGLRLLSFNRSVETRMSLRNPMAGHFEYTEYFHLPWLWNDQMESVLMIGLGGGSAQRAFQYYYPKLKIDSVELDPTVEQVAKRYFYVQETATHRIHIMDGRVFLRRSHAQYDVIILDAYTSGRYGSQLPFHLVTKEFFELAKERLTENGIVAYNIIGTLQGWQADIVGAVYKTMKEVFPQVYSCPSSESLNVVLLATRSAEVKTPAVLRAQAIRLARSGRTLHPTLTTRLNALRVVPPLGAIRAPILTDDFAPVDGLLSSELK